MAWGAAIGAGLSYLAAKEQADAAESGTRRSMGLQRDQFDYAKDLQQQLLTQQEPRRQASQRAMRSLSSIMGLGDPGPSAPIGQQQDLQSLKEQIQGTDKFLTTGGRIETQRDNRGLTGKAAFEMGRDEQVFVPEETKLNPEFQRLQDEIAALEQEMPGGEGFEDDFTPAQDITELPGYQFMQEQGLDALASSGAARGMQLSGRQLEESQRFGQGLASQYRGQLIGELQSMAGMRPSTYPVSNIGEIAMRRGQSLGGLQQQLGAIGAAEKRGTYSALGGALSSLDFGGGNNFSSPYDTQFGRTQASTKGYAGGIGF